MYKIKSAISNPQKAFPERWLSHDNVHKFALNGDTWNSYFHKKKMLHFMKNTKQEHCIISIFNIKHSPICPPAALIRPGAGAGPFRVSGAPPRWFPRATRQGRVQASQSACRCTKNLPQTLELPAAHCITVKWEVGHPFPTCRPACGSKKKVFLIKKNKAGVT